MRKLILLFLLFSSLAQADIVASVGVGKGVLEGNGTPFERVAILGYQWSWGDFFVRPQAGWFEDLSGNGKSSLWVSPLVGLRALSQVGPELHLGIGPSYLQNPDQVLGGHFQFNLEGGIGICDKNVCILADWVHISSGGFEMPNQGRDFLVVQVRLLTL